MKSAEMNVKDARIKVMEFENPQEILGFIEGDDRKTLLEAADGRLKELKHPGLKLGETPAVTEKTDDFKEGVTGTKEPEKGHVTGEDVIKKLREAGRRI